MRGAAAFEHLTIPTPDATGWTPFEVRAGLVALEQLARQVEAARLVLVSHMGAAGRDTTAAIVRATGRSARDARRIARAAQTAQRLPEALDAVRSGQLSADHLAAVAGITDDAQAAGLLEGAATLNVDDFADVVAKHRVAQAGDNLGGRQRSQRRLRFFDGPDSMVGFSGLLPSMEGTWFRSRIDALVDAAYRRTHPERADHAGTHASEPLEQRMADALAELIGAMPSTSSRPLAGVRSAGEPPANRRDDTAQPDGEWVSAKDGPLVGRGPSPRPVMVVIVDPERLTAEIVPRQPVPFAMAATWAAQCDVYAAVRDHTNWANLRLGRNRRLASPIQKLALMVRDQRCVYPGCDAPASRHHAHHTVEFERDGQTDIDDLAGVCDPHHHHVHINRLTLTPGPTGWEVRSADGSLIDTDPLADAS